MVLQLQAVWFKLIIFLPLDSALINTLLEKVYVCKAKARNKKKLPTLICKNVSLKVR